MTDFKLDLPNSVSEKPRCRANAARNLSAGPERNEEGNRLADFARS